MEQVFEGTPKADIRLEGTKLIRGPVANDWGSRLQWQIKRDGKVVATPPARADEAFDLTDTTPGEYEIVLQLFKYVNYKKDKDGQFTESKFVDISNVVKHTVAEP